MSYLMDPDEFVTCPYDSNHRVQVHRLQMHILKCKKVRLFVNIIIYWKCFNIKELKFKNNPERSRNLVSCPFNALHLCYPNEIDEHMTKCLDAEHFLKPKTRPTELKGDLNVPTYVHRKAFNTETEDWDDENEGKI